MTPRPQGGRRQLLLSIYAPTSEILPNRSLTHIFSLSTLQKDRLTNTSPPLLHHMSIVINQFRAHALQSLTVAVVSDFEPSLLERSAKDRVPLTVEHVSVLLAFQVSMLL